jgi:ABC-2 type transport system permease protein
VLARAEVDDALQAAAGRRDVVATSVVTSSEPGSRYVDFLIPGLLGMNLMNSGQADESCNDVDVDFLWRVFLL